MSYNCEGLNKEDVLLALYNNAKSLGMGFVHFKNNDMTLEDAKKALEKESYFDYHNGRVMKISFDSYPIIQTFGYNRDNDKRAEEILDDLRKNIHTNLSNAHDELTQEEKSNLKPSPIQIISIPKG